jgi:tetratricopeptide (TPR) repeat protein
MAPSKNSPVLAKTPASSTPIDGSTAILYSPTEECFKDLAEFFEREPEEALRARTQGIGAFRDLGPADLVQVTKGKPKGRHEMKQAGSYHWVAGMDCSSSAAIAVYVTNLAYSLGPSQAGNAPASWFGRLAAAGSPYRVTHSTVCVWDAFGRVDVRVEVSIPGGVRSYALDQSLRMIPTTPQLWLQAHVSSCLRAMQGSPTAAKGLRRLDLFPTPAHEARFLEAASALFWEGWRLGHSLASPQQANALNNRLAQGILEYALGSQRPQLALDFFTPLAAQDDALNVPLVKALLAMDREGEAVRLMHQSLTKNPALGPLLHTQFDFLLSRRGEVDSTLPLLVAQQAIKVAPMDLEGWARLAALHIRQGEWEQALRTLNSFPFMLPLEADPTRMPPAAAFCQPRKDLTLVDLSAIEPVAGMANAGLALEGLRAAQLKGTPREAYRLLVRICEAVGWERLLALRAAVFVMEEDYQQGRAEAKDPVAADRQQVLLGKAKIGEDAVGDSPLVVRSPLSPQSPSAVIAEPTKAQMDKSNTSSSHTKKRLCERWLDTLFMVLFEDMRVYTVYQAELAHHAAEGRVYHRTPREWLILGDLCFRLGHPAEAREAYQRCADLGFSAGAWRALLDAWAKEGRWAHALTAASHLLQDADNRYEPLHHPSPVTLALCRMIRAAGLQRIRSILASLDFDKAVQRHFDAALSAASETGVMGSDY